MNRIRELEEEKTAYATMLEKAEAHLKTQRDEIKMQKQELAAEVGARRDVEEDWDQLRERLRELVGWLEDEQLQYEGSCVTDSRS